MKKAGSLYYISVADPIAVRRDALMSAKLMVSVLQSHIRLKEIRKQKVAKTAELMSIIHKLENHFDAFHKLFPENLPEDTPEWIRDIQRRKEEVPVAVVQEPIVQKKSKFKSKKRKPAKKKSAKKKPSPQSDLEKLEKTLSLIEKRLQNL